MPRKEIPAREQNCIAECIFKHWGVQRESKAEKGDESRDESYEQCLTDCQVC